MWYCLILVSSCLLLVSRNMVDFCVLPPLLYSLLVLCTSWYFVDFLGCMYLIMLSVNEYSFTSSFPTCMLVFLTSYKDFQYHVEWKW